MMGRSAALVMVMVWLVPVAVASGRAYAWQAQMGWLENPALLGDPTAGPWEICLADGAMAVRNNSFNLDLYRTYNGAYLDDNAKRRILESISGESIQGSLRGEVGVLGLRVGRIALVSRAYAGGDLSLSKEAVELLFFGNEVDRRFDLLGSGGYMAYLSVGTAFGTPLRRVAGWETSVGVGARVAVGAMAARITESSLSVLTEVQGLSIAGRTAVRRTKTDGDGGTPLTVALDIGARAHREQWDLFLAVSDLGPGFSWAEGEEHVVVVDVDRWTAEMGDSGYATSDTTYDTGPWSTPLPTRLRCRAVRVFSWGESFIQWEQGLRRWAGVTTEPRVELGTAWNARSWLCPWLALGVGSPEGFGMTLGVALHPASLRFRVEVTGFRIPPSHSEALGVRLMLGFAG